MGESEKYDSRVFEASHLFPWADAEFLERFRTLETALNTIFKPETKFFEERSPAEIVDANFKSCLDTLEEEEETHESPNPEGVDERLHRIVVDNFFRGLGIAEIIGPSACGKTTFALEATRILGGNTLYIDTCGALDAIRLKRYKNIIPVAVFTAKGLVRLLQDFLLRIKADAILPFCHVAAKSISTLVIDSLWFATYISPYKQRNDFFDSLSILLRRVSWEHNICVVVVRNTKPGAGLVKRINLKARGQYSVRWQVRCYVHVCLEVRGVVSKVLPNMLLDIVSDVNNSDAFWVDSAKHNSMYSEIVKRFINIKSCHALTSGWLPFSIEDGTIVVLDANENKSQSDLEENIHGFQGSDEGEDSNSNVVQYEDSEMKQRYARGFKGYMGSGLDVNGNIDVALDSSENLDDLDLDKVPWRPKELYMLGRFLSCAMTRWSREPKVDLFPAANSHQTPRKRFKRCLTNSVSESNPASDGLDSIDYRAKNLCLIKGQTGCGKVTVIKALCKRIGLKVIEYDPFDYDTGKFGDYGGEAPMASLLKFLETSRSRNSLKMTNSHSHFGGGYPSLFLSNGSDGGNSSVKRGIFGSGVTGDTGNAGDANNDDDDNDAEPHVTLLTYLPRSTAQYNNSRHSGYFYRLQHLLKAILDGDLGAGKVVNPAGGQAGAACTYPLIICANTSTEDTHVLRKILPVNYNKHPRFLSITLSQIPKTRMRQILVSARRPFNDLVTAHMAEASCGDIRFALVNTDFYSLTMTSRCKLANVVKYMQHRCAQSHFFGSLGRILYNKRVPSRLIADEFNEAPTCKWDVANLFKECLESCRNFEFKIQARKAIDGILSDYSDILEIIPTIDSSTDDMGVSCLEYMESINEDQSLSGAFDTAADDDCSDGFGGGVQHCDVNLFPALYRDLAAKSFEESPLQNLPLLARCFGLVHDYSDEQMFGYTRWPRIIADTTAVPSRISSRDSMFPKLTRPQLYYNPDELVENECIALDCNNYTHCIFDNYLDFYSHIADVANFTSHLVDADVISTGMRHLIYTNTDIEALNVWLAKFCTRAALDCNACSKDVGGVGGNEQGYKFHAFKSTWINEYRSKSDHFKELYHLFRTELGKYDEERADEPEPLSLSLMNMAIVFQEILPCMHACLGADASMQLPGEELHSSWNLPLDSWEECDEIEAYLSIGSNACTPQAVAIPLYFVDDMAPSFVQLLTQVAKHY